MTKQEILETLRALLPKIGEQESLRFGMVGSANLNIQGIDIVASDIDFVTNDIGVEYISRLFHSDINRENPYIKTEFQFAGADIEFVSNEKNPLRDANYLDNIRMFTVDGLNVPVISLSAERETYIKMGRDKDKLKVGQIDSLLKKA